MRQALAGDSPDEPWTLGDGSDFLGFRKAHPLVAGRLRFRPGRGRSIGRKGQSRKNAVCITAKVIVNDEMGQTRSWGGHYRFKRIGLEAGPLSQWLYSVLAEAGLPVICVETRHMRAMLKAQINKTDRNDARGIAQMMRVGLYRPVHVKTLRSQKLSYFSRRPSPSRTTCVPRCATSALRWA
jgi:hypothetical protein